MSRVRTASRVEGRLVPHRWAWAEANAESIASHWARRRAERPALFNGRVLMLRGLEEIAEDALDAAFFETDYASLMAWLDLGRPDGSVANGFAMGALRGADGAFVLGRMGPHTANAGQLYFPAGTPDLDDVTEAGSVDLGASLLREMAEETGLRASELSVDPHWTVIEEEGQVAFLRIVRLAVPAAEACARIRTFLAAQARPELSDVAAVAGEPDLEAARMPPFLPVFLRGVWSRQIE